MRRSALSRDLVILVPTMVLMLGIVAVVGQQPVPTADETLPQQEGIEVLARGPLHEAFAEQVNHDPKPGIVVPKAPPEPISEEPPEYKPEEGDVSWIPGYWGWDDEREDYIWISGVWRNAPRGQRWVPGYWDDTGRGFQWVSGFWQSSVRRQVQYLEQPPESLERGPSTKPPTENYFWVPGCWVHRTKWLWRAGHWRRFRANSVWVQDHYVWTPRGVIFVDGYWDRRFALRGQLYAPVYISPVVFSRPLFVYRPYCVIDLDAVRLHMFVRPSYCHYYFGDFYDPSYLDRHIYSNLYFHTRLFGCDPILSYHHCHYSHFGINYFNHLHNWHSYYGLHPHHRPGHTFGAQLSFAAGGHGSFLHVSVFVHSALDVAHPGHHHHQDLVALGDDHRHDATEGASRIRELAQQRQLTEREVNPLGTGSSADQLAKSSGGSWKLPQHRPVPGSHARPEASPRVSQPDVLSLPPGARTPKLVVNNPGSGRPSIAPSAVPSSIRQFPTGAPTASPLSSAGNLPSTSSNDRPTRPATKSSGVNLPKPPARTTAGSYRPSRFPTVPGSRPPVGSSRPSATRPSPGARPPVGSSRPSATRPSPGARPAVGPSRPSATRPSPGARPAVGPSRPSTSPPTPGARP